MTYLGNKADNSKKQFEIHKSEVKIVFQKPKAWPAFWAKPNSLLL